MASAQDRFKSLLQESIGPWLRDCDFKRRDATFRRRRHSAWQIINFQRSQWSTASEADIAVNLGVALDELTAPDARWLRRGWPLEYECDFRARLGGLVHGEDHWWRIMRITRLQTLASEIVMGLDEVGLPWLELHAEPKRFLAHATSEPSTVDFMNLHSWVALARAAGSSEQLAVAQRRLDAW